MPRVNANRQKNKPFKSKSKGSTDRKKGKASTKTKTIVKPKGRVKNTRNKLIHEAKEKKGQLIGKIQARNDHLDQTTKSIVIQKLKNQAELKIVVLFSANKDANPNGLISQIYKSLEGSTEIELKTDFKGIPYPALQLIPNKKSFIRNKIMIISGERINKQGEKNSEDLQSLLDLLKCADIICPVLSCKSTDIHGMLLNPLEKGGAFDQIGYTVINMIRSLGTPTTIGIVQDLNLFEIRHHDKIENLFKRFISSELGQEDKINYLKGNQHQHNKLLRQIDTTTLIQQSWKQKRGFMLVEDMSIDQNSGNLTFHGYLKGNGICANQLAHITGFDDYEIEKIQIRPTKNHKYKKEMMNEQDKNLVQYATFPESLFPFSKAEEISEDILSGFNKMQLSENKEVKQNQMGEEQNIQQQFEDQSEEDDDFDDEDLPMNKQEQRTKRIEMHLRKDDELQFQDEVEYAAQDILREKYKEYQGLKNFKTSQWNELENLPQQYDRIYVFKHYQRTYLNALAQNEAKSFAYPNLYISVTLKNCPKEEIMKNYLIFPTILTFLLKHERKMTQIHLKVRRNPYYLSNQSSIQSNQHYAINMGFRRIIVRPIFSRLIQGTQKTKFIKKIGEDYESYFYCSFYYYNYFPPAPVQIYRVNQLNFKNKEASPIMYGSIAKCDPLHIILQRIILAGYPFKINKRRSTVRFMFFNPKDVKYFKPVEVRSKNGLRGRIEQSLGTHGYMKVLFNDKIKHNDTVCMSLYRRVFPEPNF